MVIIDSERDKREYEWLLSQVGEEAIQEAIKKLSGERKPFVSNIAKVLGLKLPESLKITPTESAKKHLADIKALLPKP